MNTDRWTLCLSMTLATLGLVTKKRHCQAVGVVTVVPPVHDFASSCAEALVYAQVVSHGENTTRDAHTAKDRRYEQRYSEEDPPVHDINVAGAHVHTDCHCEEEAKDGLEHVEQQYNKEAHIDGAEQSCGRFTVLPRGRCHDQCHHKCTQEHCQEALPPQQPGQVMLTVRWHSMDEGYEDHPEAKHDHETAQASNQKGVTYLQRLGLLLWCAHEVTARRRLRRGHRHGSMTLQVRFRLDVGGLRHLYHPPSDTSHTPLHVLGRLNGQLHVVGLLALDVQVPNCYGLVELFTCN
mmetsp:Transcript_38183/g.89580  ORF Transcript_38183/g.89580 Transcript_38183/m.89580 type:complete len:293 (+) Transcript_38183:2-880(+)